MSISFTDEFLSTAEAARVVHRAQDTIRVTIRKGLLPAVKNHDDSTWRVRRSDLVAWSDHARRITVKRVHPSQQVAELLATYDSADVTELATIMGIHPGNVRKHLAILAAQGRAERQADGQWVLIGSQIDRTKEVVDRAS